MNEKIFSGSFSLFNRDVKKIDRLSIIIDKDLP